jgi:N-acetylneuraminic acid mutarotase
MTEPQDLAYLQISGIGLQLSDRFYDNHIPKSYPKYQYSEVREAMERLVNENPKEGGKLGVPISAIPCYFDLLTPLGGMLKDIYRGYHNSISKEKKDSQTGSNKSEDKLFNQLKSDLSEKLIAFSKSFEYWQVEEKKRCGSCYMTYLFHKYNEKRK